MSTDLLPVDPTPAEAKPTQNQVDLLRKILKQAQANIKAALDLLEDDTAAARIAPLLNLTIPTLSTPSAGSRVVEGIFDGQKMIGENGQIFVVPANYASKSKLVSGDGLKLIITQSGNFIFKQIGPVERERLIGELMIDPITRQFVVKVNGRDWKVLTASVTYFKGEAGDEAVILVPKVGSTAWAAVENIVKKTIAT